MTSSARPDPSLAIDVRSLNVRYADSQGDVFAVRDFNLSVRPGEIVGVVGESGSGKSSMVRALIGQQPRNATVASGMIQLGGVEISSLSVKDTRPLLGRLIGTVFQDPVNSFNPSLTIGSQFRRFYRLHRPEMRRGDYDAETLRLLDGVGIDGSNRLKSYPFEFSQGQLQRVMIALATASPDTSVLLGDEITSSLDVTIQAQILVLIDRIRRERNLAVLLVTHDIGVIARVCHRVVVMYAGRIVEVGPTREILRGASHPYSRQLIDLVPRFPSDGRRLTEIKGSVPDLRVTSPGCAFAPRCSSYIGAVCDSSGPALRCTGSSDHLAACHGLDGSTSPEKEVGLL